MHVEAVVLDAWGRYLERLAEGELALAAVGGFGRRELFPHSDVDLLLLTARRDPGERRRAAFAEFLRALWDAGLRVSQSVHTPAGCCELCDDNVELSVSLLDQRFLAGSREVHAELEARLPRLAHSHRHALMRRLAKMARARHARYGGSIHQLEPNVKEGPGGLRDWHVICWLDRLRRSEPHRLPAAEPNLELLPARDFLFRLRSQLHLAAGRDMNVLTFDLADEIAETAGIPVDRWMREYYTHARAVSREVIRAIEGAEEQAGSLLVQFRDWRSRVSNADFHVTRERVYFRAFERLEFEPPLVLRLFEFVARHGLRLASETERRLAGHMPRLRRFFAESRPVLWPALQSILLAPNAGLALRSMDETGVLHALLPEWERVDCLVVRDFYHRYTVEEHTLTAIEELERLGERGSAADARFAGLLAETGDLALLKLALLLHDLGKADATGAHAGRSARIGEEIMARIQVPAGERAAVRLLVNAHLDLSTAMTSRDLDDPATIRSLADRASTLEDLQRLTLVTYADISAVNPAAMTPWRRDELWRLYLMLRNELTRELEDDRVTSPPFEDAGFLEGLPVRYLRTHTPEDIRAHAGLEQLSRARGVAIDLRHEGGYWRLTLAAHDRPALLASIAGALAGFGMNILKAEGFANRRGAVLDIFVFADPHRTLELNPTEADRLRLVIERVTLGRTDVRALLQSRPKPSAPARLRRMIPTVALNDAASETATLVEIVTADRPGLLYSLASAISGQGANIEVALIHTEAHRAFDVFYVTRGGRKLTAADQAALAAALRRAVD